RCSRRKCSRCSRLAAQIGGRTMRTISPFWEDVRPGEALPERFEDEHAYVDEAKSDAEAWTPPSEFDIVAAEEESPLGSAAELRRDAEPSTEAEAYDLVEAESNQWAYRWADWRPVHREEEIELTAQPRPEQQIATPAPVVSRSFSAEALGELPAVLQAKPIVR